MFVCVCACVEVQNLLSVVASRCQSESDAGKWRSSSCGDASQQGM